MTDKMSILLFLIVYISRHASGRLYFHKFESGPNLFTYSLGISFLGIWIPQNGFSSRLLKAFSICLYKSELRFLSLSNSFFNLMSPNIILLFVSSIKVPVC